MSWNFKSESESERDGQMGTNMQKYVLFNNQWISIDSYSNSVQYHFEYMFRRFDHPEKFFVPFFDTMKS